MPVFTGKKSEKERFAGAKQTFCMEALMQDGKSLQTGTSHDLGENFAKSFNVTYLDSDGKTKYVSQTSWGVSTRLIGGLIMIHGDDKGIIIPPKIAPVQIVIIPIFRNGDTAILDEAKNIYSLLNKDYSVKIEERTTLSIGEKYYHWEKKGVPIRIEIGPKDLAEKKCVLVRRDTNEKMSCAVSDLKYRIPELIEVIQNQLFQKALERREKSNKVVNNWKEFKDSIKQGGYVFAHWCEKTECELAIKEELKANTRCHPFDYPEEEAEHACIRCGEKTPSKKRWIFAKAY